MSRSDLKTSIVCFFTLLAVLLPSSKGFTAQLRLAWNANAEPDLAGYKVYYGTGSRTYGTPINVGKVTTYTLTGLIAGQTYYIAVTAFDTAVPSNDSGYSNEVSGVATNTGVAPSAPALSSPSNGATGIATNPTLSWGASSGATSYRVQVSTSSAFTSTVANLSGITGTSYGVSGLSLNTLYYWRVNATNAAGTSGWSSVWYFRTTEIVASLTVINSMDHAIEYAECDPTGALGDFVPIGGSSTHAPALAVFLNRQYLAAKGNTDNNIYVRYQDYHGNWAPWETISGATSASPAMAVFNNRLYMAANGATNNHLYLRSMGPDGVWDPSWTTISGQTTEAPALAVFNNRLYLFVKGAKNDNGIYYQSMDTAENWQGTWSVLPGATTKSIGISAFNNRLYVFAKGATDNNIYYRRMDASGVWGSWATVSGQTTTEAPSVIVLEDRIYVAVKGAYSNNVFIRSMDLLGSWDPSWTMVPANTDKTPVLSTFYYNP